MMDRMVWAVVAATICLLAAVPAVASVDRDGPCDFFCYMTEANKASLVMLREQELLPDSLARQVASAIDRVAAEQAAPGAKRWTNYLDFEERLVEIAGSEASRLHTGRSRQDLHETVRRMQIRDAFLEVFSDLLVARDALLALAGRHVDTIVPAYTHGVQAQPISLAHYLLAFSAALGRDAERCRELYARLNLSPLGAAALGTSGFAIDRLRLAALLGFRGPVENAFDANLLHPADLKIEFAGALANSAIHVGQFAQDLHAQYREPRPWMLVDPATADVSSIMPQKRNPRPVDRLRSRATAVVAGAQAVMLAAHNTHTGMNDYREAGELLSVAAEAGAMYRGWARLLEGLRVSPEAARAALDADYSTMTEVADTLLREAEVPFRVAHHYASELTEYGRRNGKRPLELTDAEIAAIYREANGTELPVAVGVIREAMDPAAMVASRKGLGGPQPAEIRRMLASQKSDTDADRSWLAQGRGDLLAARQRLDARFAELRLRE